MINVTKHIKEKIQPMAHRLTQLLGTEHGPEEVMTLYRLCAYELVILGEERVCKLFLLEDLPHLDRLEDLVHWADLGPWYPLHRIMGCPLAQTIQGNFREMWQEKEKGDEHVQPRITMRFGHSESLILLLDHLVSASWDTRFYPPAPPPLP